MNIAQWFRANGEVLRTAELSHFMHTGYISEEASRNLDNHWEWDEYKDDFTKCENCVLYNTNDCDVLENADKCVSFSDKNFDKFNILNF